MNRYACNRWLLVLWLMAPAAGIQALEVTVLTAAGEPLANAVLWAVPEDSSLIGKRPSGDYVMDQIDRQFVPHVLAVPRGAQVSFPNSDTVLHHVYSFSSAKTFEIKLYKGTSPEEVVFNQPGIVDVGCNIHDWMLGYIVVVDTPYFVKTDVEGKADLSLQPGSYTLSIWHDRFTPVHQPESRELDYQQQKSLEISVQRDLRPALGQFQADQFSDY